MTKNKPDGVIVPPSPPLPKSLLREDDPEYLKPEALKPDDLRAKILLDAGVAIDILDWHARNMADPKSSIAACAELLDRAGFVAPAKGKGDPMGAAMGGVSIPPPEDDAKLFAESWAERG